MAKGTRYTPESKAKAVRLLTESRGSYSSETKAIEQVAKDLGVAPETLRRWRDKTDATVAAETKQSAEDAMAELRSLRAEVARLRLANEILTTASAFSRHGSTRHGVDGRLHRRIQGPFQGRADPQGAGRFAGLRVHHAARLPHVQIQARQPHGRQARGAGPRHPRDPCRFLHGRVRVPQDARPVVGAGLGSDQVMNVMRESGIRGVRRGRTPVTTKPARGTGGGPDLVERRFEAEAPNRLHVADITYVRMANGSFGYTAFAADVFARRIVGWACATTMDTGELPLQALEQAISWAASHGGTDGLVHRSGHGARCIGLVYVTGVGEFGMLPSAGTVGDSYDNAMAGSADGAYKTGLVWRRKPFRDLRDLELATFRWVSWWNSKRLHRSLGYRTPERTETEYYANQAAQAAPL